MTNIVDTPQKPAQPELQSIDAINEAITNEVFAEAFAKANAGESPIPDNNIPGVGKQVVVGVEVVEVDNGFKFELFVTAKEKPTKSCAHMAMQMRDIIHEAVTHAVEYHKQAMEKFKLQQEQELPLEVDGQPLGEDVPLSSYLECDPATGVKDVSENT